ncbi:protein kinase [Streptomyces sp. NPDC058289]|uniref:protein kinase domain-containing protein n=1 Tax=Streptomyces sp. NPDC058289 TaxID=3346425 RepID=UPI0036E68AE0
MGDQLAGRYRLEQRLGKGGFGEVWRAHDTALDRAVAVKVLLETAMADEAVARFRREATIGARLQHPGITVVHDVGQEEGRLFIVMELLAGEDLRSTLSRVPGGLPVPVALELVTQAAEALAAAHERSVIHRDLKPANLFLMPTGRVKICDFGIAHSSDATAGWTVTGRIFGSPPYMAPEQWRGERVDARCDLYALGCVMYALLSGEPPFGEAEVPYVLMRRHIEDLPRSLREAGAVVAPEVERLVRQLLEKDPADRPGSAQSVATAIRALPGGSGAPTGGGARDGSGAPAGSEAPDGSGARVGSPAGGDARSGAGGANGARGGPEAGPGAGGRARAGDEDGFDPGARGGAGVGTGSGNGSRGGNGSGRGVGGGPEAGAKGEYGADDQPGVGVRPGPELGNGAGGGVGGRPKAGDGYSYAYGADDQAGAGVRPGPGDENGAGGGVGGRPKAGDGYAYGADDQAGARVRPGPGDENGAGGGGGTKVGVGDGLGARDGDGLGARDGDGFGAGDPGGVRAGSGVGIRSDGQAGVRAGFGAANGAGSEIRAGFGAADRGGAEIQGQFEAADRGEAEIQGQFEAADRGEAEIRGGFGADDRGGAEMRGGAEVGEVPAEVRAFVRELLLEAEVGLRGLEPGDEARIEVLTVAADAAARFDAGLAGRLLGDAEIAAWEGGRGDGARVARLLTRLARATSTRAPARARRLLTDAQQALFTVFGSDREGPLCEVAEELAVVAPGQAARIAADHFADARTDKRLRARVATAVAAADPAEAELQLALIPDAGQRGAATYDMVVAVAPHDVAAALRLSERIGSAGGRLLALCQVARDRSGSGDPAGGARALEQAEEELPRFLEERAAWLREEAAQHAGEGRFDRAERLRKQADALLGGRPGEAADAKADHALASLATARAYREQDARLPLDPEAAREWAGRARNQPEPAQRSLQLALGARLSVGTGRVPWLAAAAADAGSPPPPGIRALGGPDTGAGSRLPGPGPKRRTEPGARAWRTEARPDAAYAAGAHVVWRSGAEVGCVRAGEGTTRWTARSDEGVGSAAPPLPGTGPLLVACTADAATVYVEVRRDGAPGVRLLAREPRDGRVRWWRDLPGTEAQSGTGGARLPAPRPRPLRSAGPVLVHGAPGDLTALRAATGEVLWQRPVPDPATRSPAAVGDCLVLADELRLRAVHLPTGRPVWSFQRSRPTARTLHDPRLAGSGLVHLLDEGALLALEQGSGREVWRFAPGAPAEGGPLVERGTVYAVSHAPEGRDGREGWDTVHALDAGTGALRWLRQAARCGGAGCGFELLGLRPGGLYVKVPQGGRRGLLGRSPDPYVAVLDPASGRPRRYWDHPPPATAEALLVGDHLVLSRPELTAYELP